MNVNVVAKLALVDARETKTKLAKALQEIVNDIMEDDPQNEYAGVANFYLRIGDTKKAKQYIAAALSV